MAEYEIFSKRQKRLRGELPDTYRYDDLPNPLRVQVVFILRDVCLEVCGNHLETQLDWFEEIHNYLARKYGVFRLHRSGDTAREIVEKFILVDNVDRVLDVIEVSLRIAYINEVPPETVKELNRLVEELNGYFHENGIGYQFESGLVAKVNSKFQHQEVVKPALHLLRASHFAGAEKEFRKAHKHYRKKEFEDAISESLKALESTLKVICKRKKWLFDEEKDTAKKLIQIVFSHGLIPKYLQSQFTSLQSLLESGVPTMRNRDSGHGRGTTRRRIPSCLAAFALHLTASAIVFLAEAAEE